MSFLFVHCALAIRSNSRKLSHRVLARVAEVPQQRATDELESI